MRLQLKVTAKDIKKGIPGNCHRCAVALAVAREFATDPNFIDVTDEEIVVCDSAYYTKYVFDTTAKLDKFISKFDLDKTSVTPTIFTLSGKKF